MDLTDRIANPQIVRASLPGRAVCVAATVAGVQWVVVDPDKPDAELHLAELLG